MSTKSEPPSAGVPVDPAATAAPAGVKPNSKVAALLPVLLAVVLAPAVSWATAQFVLLPRLKAELAKAMPVEASGAVAKVADASGGPEPAATAAPEKSGKDGGHGKKGEAAGDGHSYTFENVVVNLAGTMGTRYLKTTFMVTGTDATLRAQFEANRPRLIDVSLNVLSSLTLADLDEPGAKNILREKLRAAYNQALGRKVALQIYFSDFVVQ